MFYFVRMEFFYRKGISLKYKEILFFVTRGKSDPYDKVQKRKNMEVAQGMDNNHQKCACTNRPMRLQNPGGSCGYFEADGQTRNYQCDRNRMTSVQPSGIFGEWWMGNRESCPEERGSYRERDSFGKCGMMPGMTYVPWQEWGRTYPLNQAISRGTIFPDLDYPFEMGRCR
ncbi:spore coat associated protein CotJA [Brotaphodocola sp.]|uniref:spore coat associated protein CotJA n=1 Tax=Brotaphodocola sp. TaxID=3073577 RepID=UPI003D7D682B